MSEITHHTDYRQALAAIKPGRDRTLLMKFEQADRL